MASPTIRNRALRPGALPATALAAALLATPAAALAENGEHVVRSAFTVAMDGREPANVVETIGPEHDRIYYFTELHNLTGQTVRHRWVYNGEPQATIKFQVGGPRWRVYSSKQIPPTMQGDWKVMVINEDGDVLKQERLRYRTAADL